MVVVGTWLQQLKWQGSLGGCGEFGSLKVRSSCELNNQLEIVTKTTGTTGLLSQVTRSQQSPTAEGCSLQDSVQSFFPRSPSSLAAGSVIVNAHEDYAPSGIEKRGALSSQKRLVTCAHGDDVLHCKIAKSGLSIS